MLNGLIEEDCKYFHNNGNLRAKGSYIKGKKSGEWLTYYNNGNMRSEEVYREGKKSGVWAFYYRSGNIRTEEEYRDNRLEGIWKFYLESGELIESGFQKNGLRDGYLEIFDKSQIFVVINVRIQYNIHRPVKLFNIVAICNNPPVIPTISIDDRSSVLNFQ